MQSISKGPISSSHCGKEEGKGEGLKGREEEEDGEERAGRMERRVCEISQHRSCLVCVYSEQHREILCPQNALFHLC